MRKAFYCSFKVTDFVLLTSKTMFVNHLISSLYSQNLLYAISNSYYITKEVGKTVTTLRIFSKKKYLQVTEKWNRDGVNYHWYIQHIIESFQLSRFSNAKPIIINFYKLHVSNNEKRHKKDERNLTHLSWNWEMYYLLLPTTVFVLPIMWNFLEN